MHIRSRAAAAISDLIIGILSLIAEWFLLGRYGWAAVRFFPTWVLFLSAVYFLSAALLITLRSKRDPNRKPYPMFEGMILMGFLLISGTAIASLSDGFILPKMDLWLIWLLCAGLPILVFADWLFFARKGYWHPMAPFYWTGLPLTYAAAMILTAEFLPDFTTWLYPLEFLNYYEFGLWDTLGWLTVISLLVLVTGYALYLLDLIMSGRLSKYIVLPHIQTVLVDEYGRPISQAEEKNATAVTDANLGRYDSPDRINKSEQKASNASQPEKSKSPKTPPKTINQNSIATSNSKKRKQKSSHTK